MEIKFDRAFKEEIDQEDVYDHFEGVIPKVIGGYNVTVFAYGQTGSGKTYTMFGRSEGNEKGEGIETGGKERGIIPRAIEQLFKRTKDYKQCNVFCSFLQIYNERIYDLLQVRFCLV